MFLLLYVSPFLDTRNGRYYPRNKRITHLPVWQGTLSLLPSLVASHSPYSSHSGSHSGSMSGAKTSPYSMKYGWKKMLDTRRQSEKTAREVGLGTRGQFVRRQFGKLFGNRKISFQSESLLIFCPFCPNRKFFFKSANFWD